MPSTNFLMNTRDIKFVIKEWLPMDKLLTLDAYKEYYGIDDIDNFLDVNYKICRDVIAPANAVADEVGATFVGGNEGAVVTRFKTVYNCSDAGWPSSSGPRRRQDTPVLVCPILKCSPLPRSHRQFWCSTQVQPLCCRTMAPRKSSLPDKMFAGKWCGTMGLTEPGAGSEVGAVASKAFPTDIPHVYKMKGQKCFITSGDHDLAENIVHLMLAKLPGAAEGTAGISLFIVPKYWVDPDTGEMQGWNDVTSVGIEHKMGIHGSSTLTLAMGENDNCLGWMVGEYVPGEDGRAKGMSQMFAYMNEERLHRSVHSGLHYCCLLCSSGLYQDPRTEQTFHQSQGPERTHHRARRRPPHADVPEGRHGSHPRSYLHLLSVSRP